MPNEKWWGNKPKLDKIVYKQMADTASLNAFQNGEIDAVEAYTKDDIKAIRSVKDAQLRIGYSTKTRVLQYNGKSKPLDDLQVRKAITQPRREHLQQRAVPRPELEGRAAGLRAAAAVPEGLREQPARRGQVQRGQRQENP